MDTAVTLDELLPLVRKPGRYLGAELNIIRKDHRKTGCSVALVFPDLYEIGMSHQGLQILYQVLNNEEEIVAERCYCVDTDMEELLRRHRLPLTTLESGRPLAEFDIIGITLPYELCYTNILTILDLAGIPLRSAERDRRHPLILGGGPCSLNPEPVAEFFDAILLGDGEEAVLEIVRTVRAHGRQDRESLLRRLAAIRGVYVPALFRPVYEDDRLVRVEPLVEGYESVRRRVVAELLPVELLEKPLVPLVKPVHDRLGVEIARGCTRGCRFCQAGITYRPVRERSVEDILRLAEAGIDHSGFDELALLSLSTGDFSCLPELMALLMDRFASRRVSVSMPSMRVGTLKPEIMAQIRRVRKTGFTVAPEAGTDRLREVINKGISEEDLLATCRDACRLGWNLIKLYFMVGLPTETMEDVEAIAELARKTREAGLQGGRNRLQINVSVATFIPKPHTPFQWEPQLDLAAARERIDLLKRLLPRRGYRLKWHDPEQSYLEGVFSRGDRRLSRLIETAWRSGARLDGWSEQYSLANWQEAAAQCGLDLDQYLRGRDPAAVLPWSHLDSGVEMAFLREEFQRALERTYTPDCRNGSCQGCGLCDFREIRPLVNSNRPAVPARVLRNGRSAEQAEPGFRYRFSYSRLGRIRFLGHLEMLQLIFRALQRARFPVLFSRGYNPSPKVSFSDALPVGVESLAEYFDAVLAEPLQEEEAVRKINRELPDGLTVYRVVPSPARKQGDLLVEYEISLPADLQPEQVHETIAAFLAADRFPVERVRKNKVQRLDLRLLVNDLACSNGLLRLRLLQPHSRAGTNPLEILRHVLGCSHHQALQAAVRKIDSRPAG